MPQLGIYSHLVTQFLGLKWSQKYISELISMLMLQYGKTRDVKKS